MSALFPVAGHAAVDPGRRWGSTRWRGYFSGDARLGRQLVDNDADAGNVVGATVLGTVVGDIGGLYILAETLCLDNCGDNNSAVEGAILAAALAVGLPALAADLSGGNGRWALLGSAVGLVSGAAIGNRVGGYPGFGVFFVTHIAMTATFALK